MEKRTRLLAWITAAVAILIVAGFVLQSDLGPLMDIVPLDSLTRSPVQPAWSGPLDRAEWALSQGRGNLAVALADSAWRAAITNQDSSDYELFIVSRRDSVPRRIYWSDAAQAESLIVRTRRIREAVLGADHLDLAQDWEDLAVLYDRQWRHHESLPFYRRMLEIRERSLDPFDPDIETSVMRLANHLRHLARYAEAESLFRRGIEIRERLYRYQIHESDLAARFLSKAYDQLGHVCVSQGKYAEAERAYLTSLNLREATYGARYPQDVGASLEYLGSLHWTLGQRAKAQAYFERSLEKREAGLGSDHPDVAASLSSLAMVQAANHEYQEAERLYKRVLDIRKRTIARDTPGGAHPGVAMSLNSLGWICTCQGRYADAERLHIEALETWNKAFGYDHPRSVGVLEDLGYTYMKAADYRASARTYARARDIIAETLGPDHPRMSEILEASSSIHRLQDRYEEAVNVAERALRIRQGNFRDNALTLDESEALSFARSLTGSRNNLISCTVDADMLGRKKGDIADIILATKGPVSDEMFDRLRTIEGEEDSTTLALKQRLRDAKFQLSSLWMARPEPDSVAHRAIVDRIEREIEDLERQITDRTAECREKGPRVTWKAVRDRLPAGAALIEYLRWQYLDPVSERSIPKYLALVLRRGADPEVIMLGEAAPIEDAVGDYRKHMGLITSKHQWPSTNDRHSYEAISDNLYGLILRPLEGVTSETATLLIAPDGDLNLVSFVGLLGGDGRYLIESHEVLLLDSGRDLLRLDDYARSGKGLLVMADPAGGDKPGEAGVSLDGAGIAPSCLTYRSWDYGLAAREYFQNTNLSPLPGARKEANYIASAWSETSSEPLALYVGVGATERRFKAEAPGKRMIHIATHGFSLPVEDEDQAGGSLHSPMNTTNPLLMTGLLLASADTGQPIPGGSSPDDGILTAYEVSAMDLTGVELVVLSACETGLGTMEDGEGVYGLRRAFQYAGAHTVISTLWPLPDDAVAGIMSRIYADAESPLPERLRSAQLEMLAILRSKGEPDHPYTWAGLTVTGAWQ